MLRIAGRIAVLACLLLGAGVANAATVGISADAASYDVGDIITLTVFTDAEGEELFLAAAFVAYTGPIRPGPRRSPLGGSEFPTIL